jgi:amino acid permease
MLAQTYLPRKAADIFGRTNNGHTPLASIMLCSAFGFIAPLAGLSKTAYAQVSLRKIRVSLIRIVLMISYIAS